MTEGAFRFLADAASCRAAFLSKDALLIVAAVARTDGGGSPGLTALRAARRAAAGVATMTSAARLRGTTAPLLDIKREDGSRKTAMKAAEKTEEKNN